MKQHPVSTRRCRGALLLALCLLLSSACGQPEASVTCELNETRACLCPPRQEGAQTCTETDDGLGWTVCLCGDDASPNDENNARDNASTPDPPDTTDMGAPPTATHDMDDDDRDMDDDEEDEDDGGEYEEPDLGLAPDMPLEPSRGAQLYTTHCSACHGPNGSGSVAGPDIREDVLEEDTEEIVEVILEGEDDMPPIAILPSEALQIVHWMKITFEEH